jgi:hypothetical protein
MKKYLIWIALLFSGSAVAQVGSPGVLYVVVAPSGACSAGSPMEEIVNGAGTVYACQSITAGVGTWTALASGSATGTVTSVGIVGTANQITVTGTSPITTAGSLTLSLPSALTLPGTLAVTGNLTTNMTGGPFCVHETSGVLSASSQDCGAGSGITLGTAGQLPVMNAGATAYAPVSLSQDCTITALGVITCLKSNNVAFGTNAFTSTAYVPQTTTVNTHPLSANVTVTAADVGLGNVTNNAQVTSVTGTSGQIAVSGTTAPTLSIPSPFTPPGTVTLASGNVLGWNSDTGLSRDAAATIDVGNGTQGDKSGTVNAANVNAGSTMSVGAGSAACGTVLGCIALAESSTGTATPSSGNAYLRADLSTNKWFVSLGGTEFLSLMSFNIAPQANGGTGVSNTATLTLGSSNVNLATQASGVVFNTTTTGALTPANPHQLVGSIQCNDTSASATAYTCTTTPSIAALTKGDLFMFTGINQNNSGAATLAIDGLSPVAIKKYQTTALASGDLQANAAVLLRYDGTNLELDTIGNPPSGSGTVTVVGAGNLTSTALVTGGGTTTLQTPSATSTLDTSGNLAVAAGGSLGSADTGSPKFTFATNKITANQPLNIGVTSNQMVFGTTTNLTTVTFPASSGAVTLTAPNVTTLLLGGNSDTTTTHLLHAGATAGVGVFSALAASDVPNNLITGAMMANATVTATQLAAQYSKGSCTEVWGGSGTSFALTSGDDAIANNSCYNDSGVTRTITAVKCRSDNASNTTTVNPTFGSAGTGTTILSGALTCGNSYAYSSSGTVSNASWTTGSGIDPAMGGTLTGTSIAMIVEFTY